MRFTSLALVSAFLVFTATEQTAQAQFSGDFEKVPSTQNGHSGSIRVPRVPDSNQFLSLVKSKGEWSRYTFPEGVQVNLLRGINDVAFDLSPSENTSISTLVAIDADGNWKTIDLIKPVQQRCVPVLAGSMVAYHVGGRIYAFSIKAGKWDHVEGPEDFAMNFGAVRFRTKDRIGAFTAASGKWAVAELKVKPDSQQK